MKKFSAVLILILTVGIIAVTLCNHPMAAKSAGSDPVKIEQTQGILPGGCVVDSNKDCKSTLLVVGHSLGIAYLVFSVILAVFCLKDKKHNHTDEEFAAKVEELAQNQAKLEEATTSLEACRADSQKLEQVCTELNDAKRTLEENSKTITDKDHELDKLKSESETLSSRAENLEKDNKGVKREVDKLNSQLNAAQKEKDDFKAQIVELKKQLEAQTEELKTVSANVKGGKEAIPPAAYQILYLLQKEGRLIDLLNEDISAVEDEDLGGAVRPVLEGCAKLLKDRLIVEPVLNDEEGTTVTVEEADPETIKLSGNVPASGPYKGELIHHGWRLKECNLPELVDGWKGNVIAPAEIEI